MKKFSEFDVAGVLDGTEQVVGLQGTGNVRLTLNVIKNWLILLFFTRKYQAAIGNNADAFYTITHNLNTRNLIVQVAQNGTPWQIQNNLTITMPTLDTVTIGGFSVTPTTNQYLVSVIG